MNKVRRVNKLERVENLLGRIENLIDRLEGRKEQIDDKIKREAYRIFEMYLDNDQFEEEIRELLEDYGEYENDEELEEIYDAILNLKQECLKCLRARI